MKVTIMPHPPIPTMGLDRPASDHLLLRECNEPMIPLSALSAKIVVYPAYYLQGYDGTKPEAFLREGAARRLALAAQQLPPDHRLVILDGWRSYQVQASLYERFRQTLLAQGWQEGEALTAELGKFVAYPSTDILHPPPHLSGGAVDLTIEGPDGWLEMGTNFDDFSELAATCYYEGKSCLSEKDMLIRDNRRLLYHVMRDAGFVNYAKEWWHFEYGTLSWARQTQQEAMYGGILSVG